MIPAKYLQTTAQSFDYTRYIMYWRCTKKMSFQTKMSYNMHFAGTTSETTRLTKNNLESFFLQSKLNASRLIS